MPKKRQREIKQQKQQQAQQLLQQQQQQQQQQESPGQLTALNQNSVSQPGSNKATSGRRHKTVKSLPENPKMKTASSVNPSNSLSDERPLLGATKVDQLMLVIQARKKGIHDQIPRASDGTILDNGAGVLPQETELVGGIDKPKSKAAKFHECSYCHKRFTQSTHLDVHVRSHIGYKPFACNYCGKRFTQGGNLRTHERLHTGEKPYACKTCGRQFSRKGNLQAHELTHGNLKPFQCKLDGCNKLFTQLGNLKAHQNRSHLKTLNELTRKLAEVDPSDEHIKPEERELLNYFADLYKNSNRGIKGRGKKSSSVGSAPGSAIIPTQQMAPQQDRTVQQQGQAPQPLKTSVEGQYLVGTPGEARFDGFNPDYQMSGSKKIEFKDVNYQQ